MGQPEDLEDAREVLIRLRENVSWLAREVEVNASISPDLAGRILADAGALCRLSAARGN